MGGRARQARFAFAVRHAETGELRGGCELRPLGNEAANLSYWTYPHRNTRAEKECASVASDHGGGSFDGWAFVGHSFSSDDKRVAECVIQTLGAVGVSVITGERPKA